MIGMTFNDQLRRAIRASGLSGYRLAKMTGISAASISRFLAGKTSLSPDSIARVFESLELKIASPRERKDR